MQASGHTQNATPAVAVTTATTTSTTTVSIRHPRGCGFRFDKKRNCFFHVESGRRYFGIKKRLQSLFYSKYTFETATRDVTVDQTFNQQQNSNNDGSRCPPEAQHRRGIKRGELLDTQMGICLSYFRKYKLTHAYFYDRETRQTWTKTEVPEHVRKFASRLLGYAKACWKVLHELGWYPVAHQLVVGCTRMRIGTMLDYVCVDRNGVYHVCEFKSGFATYYYKWTGNYMTGPFSSQTDCVFNQHQLQLLITDELYRRSYWQQNPSKVGSALLMRFRNVDSEFVAVDTHNLRDWAQNARQAAARVFETRTLD